MVKLKYHENDEIRRIWEVIEAAGIYTRGKVYQEDKKALKTIND